MILRPQDNRDLQFSFPKNVREEILQAVSVLPVNPHGVGTFAVNVNGELLSIPRRVYHNAAVIRAEKLTDLQRELLDCILTRHNDGYVRQKHLANIVTSSHEWVPPFVVQLLGEYVIEIIRVIDDNLKSLDTPLYSRFLLSNSSFLTLTRERVLSYWDCYYRPIRKDEYPGFRVLRLFENLVGKRS